MTLENIIHTATKALGTTKRGLKPASDAALITAAMARRLGIPPADAAAALHWPELEHMDPLAEAKKRFQSGDRAFVLAFKAVCFPLGFTSITALELPAQITEFVGYPRETDEDKARKQTLFRRVREDMARIDEGIPLHSGPAFIRDPRRYYSEPRTYKNEWYRHYTGQEDNDD